MLNAVQIYSYLLFSMSCWVQTNCESQKCWTEYGCTDMFCTFCVHYSINCRVRHTKWSMIASICFLFSMSGGAQMDSKITCAEWAMVMQPCLPLLYLIECEYFRKSDVLHKVAPYPYVVLFLPCSVNVLHFGSESSCEENNVFKFTPKSLCIIQVFYDCHLWRTWNFYHRNS
jgi:hypothetical protein